jgi:enoyl-CoA hydratase/carnithine racemase
MTEPDAAIRYETTDAAIWITLAGDAQARWDAERYDALYDALVRARLDPDRSVLVLRGSGARFGPDGFPAVAAALAGRSDTAASAHRHAASRTAVFEAIEACPQTAIAALNGSAGGDALALALLCDVALAVCDARFEFDAGTWGICDALCPARLPRRVGLARAAELLYTARAVDAEEAQRIGLVNRICARDELDAATAAFVADVLITAPGARNAMKRIAQRDLPPFAAEDYATTVAGADLREALRAHREQRLPRWAHRGTLSELIPSPTLLA